jgi:hypothetical protein
MYIYTLTKCSFLALQCLGSRSRHFAESRFNPDPDLEPGFYDIEEEKNLTTERHICLLKAPTKDIQAPGEASSPTKMKELFKQEISSLFPFLRGQLWLP